MTKSEFQAAVKAALPTAWRSYSETDIATDVWPIVEAALTPPIARLRADWHEDDGPALWWFFPIVEPPYAGDPREDDFPDYYTHWTPIVCPAEAAGV